MTPAMTVLVGANMTRVTNSLVGVTMTPAITVQVGEAIIRVMLMMEMPLVRTTTIVEWERFAAVMVVMVLENVLRNPPSVPRNTDLSVVAMEIPMGMNVKPCPKVSAFRSKEHVPLPVAVETMVIAPREIFVRKTLAPITTLECVLKSQLSVPWSTSLSVGATDKPMEIVVVLGVLV